MTKSRNQGHTMRTTFAGVLTFIVVAAMAVTPGAVSAQTAEASFVLAPSGNTLDVSIYIRQTGSPDWKLGMASFVFTYDTTVIEYQSKVAEGVWDDDRFPASYGDQFWARYFALGGGSMEIDFTGANGTGVFISLLDALVGTLRFNVKDPVREPNIRWVPGATFVSDDAGVDRTSGVTLKDLPVSVEAVDMGIPTTFTLEQNYPNPFNPSTTIRYGVPEAGRVRVEVFSLLGDRLTVLVDENQAPGYYQVHFDAAGLASGMYLYRVTSTTGSASRRMLLLR